MLRLGKYLLVDRINHGGMADIFLAKTFGYEGADRLIAVKCIRPDIASDASFVSMFIDEAKLAVQLDHVNIARTYDLGRIRDTYFIAMEHVLGKDLRGILDRANAQGETMAYGIVLAIMDQMLEALDYAHRKADLTGIPLRIVHRDVSPHNVLISYSGEVKLIDFGIAKATTQGNATTGVLRGKYGYMSPEQVRGERVDHRSDIFSTGALLFELLTGQRLFSGASDFSILDKVRHCEVYPPSVVMTDVTRDLERVVLRALEPDANKRYSSASDMRDAIVEVMLRRYGYRSQRDIGSFMATLFPQEIEADQARIERADAVAAIPDDVEEYTGSLAQHARLEGTDTLPDRPELQEMSVTDPEPGAGQGPKVPTVEAPPALESPEGNKAIYGGPPPPAALVSGDRYSSGAASAGGGGESEVEFAAQEMDSHRSDTAVVRRDTLDRSQPQSVGTPDDASFITQRSVTLDARSSTSMAQPQDEQFVATRLVQRRPRTDRRLRDYAILGAAVLVAAALIAFTWSYTHRDPIARGALRVVSTPAGAKVKIDATPVGTTPFESRAIPVGRHRIVLELQGYSPVERVVFVKPNALETLEDELERVPPAAN